MELRANGINGFWADNFVELCQCEQDKLKAAWKKTGLDVLGVVGKRKLMGWHWEFVYRVIREPRVRKEVRNERL